jgi:hypothetical protein
MLVVVLTALSACGDDRCDVGRRMNCAGLDTTALDEDYSDCQKCDEVVSPVFKEMGDCFVVCVAEKAEYQCSPEGGLWDDACALECTGESSVASATLRLVEMETHRFTLSACRGG